MPATLLFFFLQPNSVFNTLAETINYRFFIFYFTGRPAVYWLVVGHVNKRMVYPHERIQYYYYHNGGFGSVYEYYVIFSRQKTIYSNAILIIIFPYDDACFFLKFRFFLAPFTTFFVYRKSQSHQFQERFPVAHFVRRVEEIGSS